MIKFEKLTIPAASLGKPNPMPDIKNISYIHAGYHMTDKICDDEKTYIGKGMLSTMLPYLIQDGYDRNKQPREFNAAILENDRIKAVFLPELGGRLWSVTDKDKNRELLYKNPVFQPGNLALRNAWFSGGVEFNVGIKGHTPLTCSPMWCRIDKCPEGEILRLYEYERIRGVVYSISAWLPEDSDVLYLKCRIENESDETKYMYWWSNIAVPETKGTRVLVPTNESFLSFYSENHYILDKASIPLHEGTDVSYPGNIPSSRDFFYKIPENRHKWIAAVNEEGYGLLQCSTSELKGRKLFVWGQSQGGRNWNEWLSEEGSAYIEIQAGLAHTQLEHIPMTGKTTLEWTEAYTPLNGNSNILHGDYAQAIQEAEKHINQKLGNTDELYFPDDSTVTESEIVYRGSDWGALEEKIKNAPISKHLKFPMQDSAETAKWVNLVNSNTFPEPDTDTEPGSYVTGEFWLKKLEGLPEQNWYSLLHTGVVRYAAGDTEGAKRAWEESTAKKASPWALRSLSMIYKNELGDLATAKKYILRAFELKKDCLALCIEVAQQLTSDGSDEKWLEIYDSLSQDIKSSGRLRLYKAIAHINLQQYAAAAQIINKDFEMPDIKEGELSVSYLWFKLYRNIYAQETDRTYDENDKEFCKEANEKYPLPKRLDFRMHE